MQKTTTDPQIIVALDFPDLGPALDLARRLSPELCRLKVGKELFTHAGPALVERVMAMGFQVFLDLKFHDIPNTAAAACAAAAKLGVWMVNVHAAGGRRMMQAARERLERVTVAQRPLLVGVTVLTSMEQGDLAEIGFGGTSEENVQRLAVLAKDSGMDGVVCSPREAGGLRKVLGDGFLLVTPGVRPAFVGTDDQRRVMTPADALAAGSDYLVIGRPITAASDPREALYSITKEMGQEVSA